MSTGVGIIGTGRALGSTILTNEELCATTLTSTTPQWILEKTGIQRRFLISEGESASSLSVLAARRALDAAGIAPGDLGMIVACTFSGDYLFPPLSGWIHRELGVKGGQIYDLQANCAGFTSGVTAVTDRMLRDPSVRYALVVGVEISSPFIDYGDVETSIFFSDGAGAAVLGPVSPECGVQGSAFFADTSNYDTVRLRGGGSAFPYAARAGETQGRNPGFMEMNGLATWKQAVTHLPTTIRRACERSGWSPQDVDLYVFHQANLQLITYTLQKMRVPVTHTFTNVQEIGNTGSASIPIALADAAAAGKLSTGQRILLAGVGAGFNFGATCLIWEDHPR